MIKYIDLNDPHLNRIGIHQIEKDYDNEELRYSLRSILKNIPWIRKIFILMPNEKVQYFKEDNLTRQKIVYVKDKDFLGFDSSNPQSFLFRYWKMKKFGISNNIIIMDDDFFIGNKLEKSDFFHVENGKVVPSIITSNFLKIDKLSVQKIYTFLKSKAIKSKEEQNAVIFQYRKYSTFLFILNIFNISINESIFVPDFTHNAIPVNLNDLKEIYDIIYMSKYKYATLDCLYRNVESLQFQTFILSYTFNKFKRKIKHIPYNYIPLQYSVHGNYTASLYCINREAGNYSKLNLYQAKIIMEYLFPIQSPYEIVEHSILKFSDKYILSMNENECRKYYIMIKKEYFLMAIYIISLLSLVFIKIKKNFYIYY